MVASTAMAETVTRIQSVLSNSSDEFKVLGSFTDDVAALTGGFLKIEILPADTVVGPHDIMDAVASSL